MDLPPWLSFSWHGSGEPSSSQSAGPAVEAMRGAYQRLSAPWLELAEDVATGEVVAASSALCASFQDELQVRLGWAASHLLELIEGELLLRLRETACGGCERARALADVLAEDECSVGLRIALVAAIPCAMSAAAAAGPGPAVLLCGLTLTNKFTAGLLGVGMATGGYEMTNRLPGEAVRLPMKRAAIALVTNSTAWLLLASGWQLPWPIAQHVAHPNLLLRFLPDLISMPMLVANTGFIAGRPWESMLPTLAFTTLSAGAFCGATVASDRLRALQFLGSGTLCLIKAAWDVEALIEHAQTVSERNKHRTRLVSDALVFTWMGYPLLLGLFLMGAIQEGAEMQALVALEAINKLGVCQILLRTEDGYQRAVQAIEERRRAHEQPADAVA